MMKAEEALYLIDGLLHCDMHPKYIELLQYCREVVAKQDAIDNANIKRNLWPHCSKCGEPYAFYKVRNDMRVLKRMCTCVDAVPKMKPRPAETVWSE